MANNLVAIATGNLSDLNRWYASFAAGDNSVPTSNFTVSAVYQFSSTFTLTAGTTITGICVKVFSRVAAPVGTITLALCNNAGAELATSAINVSVIPSALDGRNGWVHFQFGTPYTPVGDETVKFGAKCSTASEVKLYMTTGTDITRVAVGNVLTAPGAASSLWIQGVNGTATAVAITQDNNNATQFAQVEVSNGGTLSLPTGASSELRLYNSNMNVYLSGVLTTAAGAAIAAGFRGIIEFECTADNIYALTVYGTCTLVGYTKTNMTLLNANAVINDTAITAAVVPTAWKDNDKIAIGSTTRTYTQAEQGALNGDVAGNPFNIDGFAGAGGGLAFAHLGTAPMQAEVINLTRSVLIQSTDVTKRANFVVGNGAVMTLNYVEFYQLYQFRLGINYLFAFTVLTWSSTGCVVWNSVGFSFYMSAGLTERITNWLFYGNSSVIAGTYANVGVLEFDGIWCSMRNGYGFSVDRGEPPIQTAGSIGYLSSNGANGAHFNGCPNGALAGNIFNGTLVCHSNGGYGFYSINYFYDWAVGGYYFNEIIAWRNASVGVYFDYMYAKTVTAWGNVSYNVQMGFVYAKCDVMTLNSDAAFTTAYGLAISGNAAAGIYIGTLSSGQTVAHTVADVYCPGGQNIFIGNALYGATPFTDGGGYIAAYSGLGPYYLRVNNFKVGGVAGSHVLWASYGKIGSGVYYGITPYGGTGNCIVLNPTYTNNRKLWHTFQIPAQAGVALSISLYACKTSGKSPLAWLQASGCGITFAASALTLSNYTGADAGWTLNTFNLGVPTSSGLVDVCVQAQDGVGAATGDVYIDKMVVTGGAVDLGELDYWGSFYPAPVIAGSMAAAAAGGGGAWVF